MEYFRAMRPVTVNSSNRHIHLSKHDMEILFGEGYKLTKIKDLVQPGEHACNETVKIFGPKGGIDKVRVLGPLRNFTQLEISLGDAVRTGINAHVRGSGDISGSSPVHIVGSVGSIDLKEGCIVAKRHIHMSPADALFYKVKDGEFVSIKCSGERALIFENVVVRVSDKMLLECHIDIDEANAAGQKNGDEVIIL